ncbi:MAG: glycosyltransferase [Gordonia paraffinivorans]
MSDVVHLTDRLKPGGVTSVIGDLAEAQRSSGKHSVTVIELSAVARGSSGRRTAWSGSSPVVAKLLRADVVHCHHRTAALMAGLLRPRAVVEQIHNVYDDKHLLSFRARRLVAVSQMLRTTIEESYPHTRGRIRVIANGVPGHARPRFECDRLRGPARVIGVGRLAHQKNPLVFIDIIRGIETRHPGAVRGHWIGDGPLADQFDNAVRDAGLTQIVTREAWRDRAATISEIAQSDVLLLPSRWEGMPIVVLEALSVGTPVLSTPTSELASAVAAAGCGGLFTGVDSGVTALAGRLALDSVSRARERRAAHEYWARWHDVTALVDQWEAVYQDA